MSDGSREHLAHTCLMLHSAVLDQMISCAEAGCDVRHNKDAGTLDIFHAGKKIVMGIQKGSGEQPWIMSFFNTDLITWGKPSGV